MTTVDIAPFLLIDPPPGAEDQVRRALSACTFPFDKITPMIVGDPEHRITIEWGDIGEPGILARYTEYGKSIMVQLNYWNPNDPYLERTLLHEIGHMVDYVYLDQLQRSKILGLLVPPGTEHNHEHPWKGTNNEPYYARIHEAWADAFVKVYAPSLYTASAYVHTIADSDVETVKAILSQRKPMLVDEVKGSTRFETAQIASMKRYPYNTPVEVVICATDTADTETAAAYVAAAPALFPATLLLVNKGQDDVPPNTLQEIDRLRFGSSVAKMTFIGGTSVVTDKARAACRAAGGG